MLPAGEKSSVGGFRAVTHFGMPVDETIYVNIYDISCLDGEHLGGVWLPQTKI
jgi:hypothetical protein